MIHVAVVGMRNIGRLHAKCYANNPHAKVVAVCDIVDARAQAAAEEFRCEAFASIKQMLSAGLRIDAAGVCTGGVENGGDHYKPTMALLEAGIPVLGEKPISNRIPEAKRMVALAKKKRLPYGINLNHRFTPAARRAKQWLDAGRLGEINMINMFLWIDNPNESGPHFHMRALHPHSLDIMRYFCGEVTKVHAFFKKGRRRKVWSNVHVNLLFKSGVIGHLMGSYDGGGPGTPWGLERVEVVGQDARFIIEDACETLVFSPRKSPETETHGCLGGMLITIIGRGHSGTRAIARTLRESGVYMGAQRNASDDLVPPEDLYEACRVMARHVRHRGGLDWDLSRLHEMPIDPDFKERVRSYLSSVLDSDADRRGWKLPETTLILPWIVRLFPDAYYIYWYRDPRDSILGTHLTDDLADFGLLVEKSDDLFHQRATSWYYQWRVMQETPRPRRWIAIRYEDFVLDQERTLEALATFLGFPLARVEVSAAPVARWRNHPDHRAFEFLSEPLLALGYEDAQ